MSLSILNKMERLDKIRYLEILIANQCFCGQNKIEGLWFCHDCWQEIHTHSSYQVLKKKCQEHIDALEKVMAEYAEYKEKITKRGKK